MLLCQVSYGNLLQVRVNLRLPVVLNKFFHPITVSAEEFFPQWRSLSGPPLKLQEVVCIPPLLHVVFLVGGIHELFHPLALSMVCYKCVSSPHFYFFYWSYQVSKFFGTPHLGV